MKGIATIAVLLLSVASSFAQEYIPSAENLAAREQFAKERFGIFIHWGIYSMMGDAEWVQNIQKIDYREYAKLAGGFYPSRFDAGEWARLFKESGARYVTITSRHHDGFSMFDSSVSDFDIMDATPFRRDIIGELSEALAENGIRLGFYYSHLDWHRLDYCTDDPNHSLGREFTGRWEDYLAFLESQVAELLTKYGPVRDIWFDGVWQKPDSDRDAFARNWRLREMYDLVHSIQPSCLVVNNHHLPPFYGEDAQTFERDLPGENTAGYSSGASVSSLPLETCQTINDNWGYCIGDHNYKSGDYLISYLARTAAKGANLLLNIGPRPDGTIPEEAASVLREMGEWLAVNGESIYGTAAGCIPAAEWGVSTQNGNVLYLHVLDECDSITLPLSIGKLLSAKALSDSAAVGFCRTRDGYVIDVPGSSSADYVIALTFKADLPSTGVR